MSRPLDAIRKELPTSLVGRIESGAELVRRRQRHRQGLTPPLSTARPEIDDLLGGGLARRQMVELVGRRSSGRMSLVLALVAAATSCGEPAALIDLGDGLDPEAALAAGTELERLLWVRPRRAREALFGTELVLASGFPLVVLELGLLPSGASSLGSGWQRLVREVRQREAVLVVSTPWRVSGAAASTVLDLGRGRSAWRGISRVSPWLAGLASHLAIAKQTGLAPGAGLSMHFHVDAPGVEPPAEPAPRRSLPLVAAAGR